MSDNVIQTSFSAGELSPNLFAKVDFAKYRAGAATMRNFFVDYRSGASTRPGTEYIRPGIGTVRLVRFQQSTTVTFVLEFGEQYIRFITQGASVVEGSVGIAGITRNSFATMTIPGHTYHAGDMIFVSNVIGMPQANDRYFTVGTVVGANFNILDALTGVQIDSTNWAVFVSGIAQRVFTISSPYHATDLPLLKFSQKGSIMNITNPNFPPYKLQLFSATSWTLTPAVFGSTATAPAAPTVTPSAAGAVGYKYAVTSVDDDNQESGPSPVTVTLVSQDHRSVPGSNLIGWTPVTAFAYNIYGSSPSYSGLNADTGGLGFMGSVPGGAATSFIDANISPDFAQTPPIHDNPFADVNPAVSSYFQQRLVFANGGGDLVATFWASKIGAPYNFDVSNPTQDDDAISAALVSLEVNEIKSLVPVPSGLIALTTHGAWLISGGAGGVATQGGAITPSTATATPQAYVGASDVPPILINYDLIFVQAKGSIVRDLTYNIYANIYSGNDISVLSSHLFYGHQILEWAYAEEPFKAVWCVREDGILLCLTLVKEQDMYGWSRHDTRGNFKSVCSVTEGHTDATYFAVQRPNPRGGGMVTYIERLADRTFPFGAEDSFCVDAGSQTVDNTPNATLQIQPPDSGGNVLVGSAPGVFGGDVPGKILRAGGGIYRVTTYIAPDTITAATIQPATNLIPDDPLNRTNFCLPGTWSINTPFTKVYGLDHLEGQSISVLADGGVVNGLTVSDGSITLPAPATRVVAGYGFQAQLQTMYLDLGNEINSVQGKRKKVGALTVRVKDSRGVKAGRTFGLVTPIKELNRTTLMGLPVPLITADERVIMDPLWDVPGQICIQVDDPLPTTILGVIPEVVIGDTQK